MSYTKHLAQIGGNEAFLFTPFGEQMARRYFGDEVVDALPKFVRGKNAGKPKGVIQWKKVIRGGWVREHGETVSGSASGHVERRVGKVISAQLCAKEWGKDVQPLHYWDLDVDGPAGQPQPVSEYEEQEPVGDSYT